MDLGSFALLPLVSRILIGIGWAAFALFFMIQRPAAGETVTKRAPASKVGIAFQMLAFAGVWMLQRPVPRVGAPLGAMEIALDLAAPVLATASIVFGLWAVRTLGRQWSFAARLVEGHQLVTSGPYAVVRHPIYTAMFGKLLASNFAYGHWIGLPVAGGLFVIGTVIRIRSEERLLRETFGAEFEQYAKRVPSFIPFVG